jgi:hypothetical protein
VSPLPAGWVEGRSDNVNTVKWKRRAISAISRGDLSGVECGRKDESLRDVAPACLERHTAAQEFMEPILAKTALPGGGNGPVFVLTSEKERD